MTIDNKIRDEKLQYDINRKAEKISALSSGKIDQNEYLTGEKILSRDQSRVIEHAKFTYSPLGKALLKEIKTIENQGEKQVEALKILKPIQHEQKPKLIEGIFPKDLQNCEIKNELSEI